jgi:hypothetical protein
MYSFLWNKKKKKSPHLKMKKKGGGRDNQKASLNYERQKNADKLAVKYT